MKVLHLDQNHPILLDQLEQAGFSNTEDYTSSKEAIEKIILNYDGIVVRSRFKIDKSFLDAAKNLKFIARVGAGLESIDIPYAENKGVKLFAAPEGNRNAVGEHTLGLLLSLFNKLNAADQSVKTGHWQRESHRGMELDGKTVGLIGYGNMGKAFAKKLSGFDCTVLCYDIKEEVGDRNATQVALRTLQEMADVVSLHTPWTPLTDKMVNDAFIEAFQKPFWFLNTARGKSVVIKDLVLALESGKILGAGLDVLEYEKSSFETLFSNLSHPEPVEGLRRAQPDTNKAIFQKLIAMPNVLLTPHIAGWTVESNLKLAETIVEKILEQFPNP
jgi:D-3-phosphoglycerate dehydrogenase